MVPVDLHPGLLSANQNWRRLLTMKSVAAVAIFSGLLTMPAWAQHGSSHGGFSGHSGAMGHSAPMGHFTAPMSHPAPVGHFSPPMSRPAPPMGHFAPMGRGTYRGPAPMRFGGPAPESPRRAPYAGAARLSSRGPGWGDRGRDRNGDRDHHRHPYFRGYGLAYSYGYPGWWPGYPFLLSSCILGCDSWDYGNYDNPYSYGAGYGQPAPSGQYGDAMMQYPGYPAAPAYNYSEQYQQGQADDPGDNRAGYSAQTVISTPLPPQPPLRVIMKDGQQLQVHNYLLTATTLTVLDENYRQIPLDQIDLGATRQQNLANGLDFRVPRAAPEASPGRVHPGSGAGETTTPRNQLSALSPELVGAPAE